MGRPSFRELFLALTGDKSQVLLIPQADGETHPLAGVLGSPLEAGKKLYKELQNKYIVWSQPIFIDVHVFNFVCYQG